MQEMREIIYSALFWRKNLFVLFFSVLFFQSVCGQTRRSLNDTSRSNYIFIQNGSFEGEPECCTVPSGWMDCGYKTETPPDIQPAQNAADALPLFGVRTRAYAGSTYLGMVVRDNETYERVGQRLISPLIAGTCYTISIFMAKSPNYISATHSKPNILNQYTTPAVLQIWGGVGMCNQRELLSESTLITDTVWTRYDFEFKPKQDLSHIELDAYYKTPVLQPYNGNILVDNVSHIYTIPCPEDPQYAKIVKDRNKKILAEAKLAEKNNPPLAKPKPQSNTGSTKAENPKLPPQKVLKDLDNKKVTVGQIIKIEKLYFAADSSSIKPESYSVLDELFEFLTKNPLVKIEIGGHTNNVPSDEYCNRLSTSRAKEVQKYLVRKGISEERIHFKGYGKRNPVSSNSTPQGKALNQRVEIKILSVLG
jgi:outer membrane protein OmpA-like peptidoglycan-associated protein